MTETEVLLSSRLVLVTGKGGTGKTTIATALARLGAASGRRVLLLEVDAQRPGTAQILGVHPTCTPRRVTDHLDVANLTFTETLRAFLEELIPSRRVVGMVLDNAAVQRFLDFTPGSRELVTLSAIAGHVERYDLVVVDMPASGHAISLLDITRSALGLFRSGPLRRRAASLRRLLRAPTTRVALIALPEEMVVNETIETHATLRGRELLGERPVVVLNRATLPTLSPPERDLLRRLDDATTSATAAEFVHAGRWEDALEQRTAEARDRLTAIAPPVLIAPTKPGSSPTQVVEDVAVALGRTAGITRRDLAALPVADRAPTTPDRDDDVAVARGDDTWLDRHRLVVCVGAGGVGKTTTAAALALRAARSGRRVMVLTIDPARRLANSLGLSALGNTAQAVAIEGVDGELWAMMLDTRQAFDELITRVVPDDTARRRIQRNHVYRHLSETLAGSQDYMATEKLYDLMASEAYDLVVLDTPPVKNALDFLESPGRLVNFLDERILGWFLHPYDSSAIGSRFLLGTSAVVYKLLGYVFGADFLDDLQAFFRDFDGLYDGFRARHAAVLGWMRDPATAFVTVCAPNETTLDVALFFQDELKRRGLARTGVIVNHVHRCDGTEHDARAVLGEAAMALGADLPDTVVNAVLARLGMAHRRLRALAVAEAASTATLRRSIGGDGFYREIERFEDDVHDLGALDQVGARLAR